MKALIASVANPLDHQRVGTNLCALQHPKGMQDDPVVGKIHEAKAWEEGSAWRDRQPFKNGRRKIIVSPTYQHRSRLTVVYASSEMEGMPPPERTRNESVLI